MFSSLISLCAVWIVALISPGPDVFQILRTASRQRRAGVLVALGICLGNTVWILASLAGLSALVTTHPGVLNLLKLIGGGYLLYLGITALSGVVAAYRASTRRTAADSAEVEKTAISGSIPASTAAQLRLGVATNLSNPKAILFFGAVFAQFISAESGVMEKLLIVVCLEVIQLLWFVGVAVAVSTVSATLRRYSAAIDTLSGTFFAGFGLYMCLSGAKELLGPVRALS
ncbi:Threonine efflux protein [Corynebacterium ciconiae DSM 44920]|uniref:LysE family translocator n=1 Tax=Corynebacterium ciconiae TaxID=227319 RepID=UPI000380B052|nr:LysE family translocator [Corynebacterium ciconiae]WKD60125.1 Threonine efflux protein [Corynebacterium ciconiae DSM 44920]